MSDTVRTEAELEAALGYQYTLEVSRELYERLYDRAEAAAARMDALGRGDEAEAVRERWAEWQGPLTVV